MFYDRIAAQFGWWYYPSVTAARAPLAWYVAATLGFGATLGLVGWRIIRRWQVRGLLVFLLLFALFGVARDYAYSMTTQFIVFGLGSVPLLADLFAYASAAVVVQLLMRWIVGPVQSDAQRLRRSRRRRLTRSGAINRESLVSPDAAAEPIY
jgi:hypothetical protein